LICMTYLKSNNSVSIVSVQALLATVLLIFSPLFLQAQPAPPTNNLQLWLRADAGVTLNGSGGVTKWTDQSANGFYAVPPTNVVPPANPPTFISSETVLNGKPAIQFDAGQYLDLQSNLDIVGDLSVFVVLELEPNVLDYRGIFDQASPVNAVPFPNEWMLNNDGRTLRVQRGDGVDVGYQQGIDWDFVFSSAPAATGRYISIAYTAIQETNIAFFQNNLSFGQASMASTLQIVGGGIPMRFGARYGTSSGSPVVNSLRGRIAELLMYDTAVSDTDRTNIATYLANKYNLAYSVTCDLAASPTNGSTVAAPANILATATTTAVGASIARVDFYDNSIVVASVTAPPYQVPLTLLNPGVLSLTAVAVDNLGLATTSAPVTLTVTGTPTFTPGSNLQLWLRSDAGVTTDGSGNVTAWADQSGQSNNAVSGGTTPPVLITNAVNGEPGIHMHGSDGEYLVVANSSSLEIVGDIACLAVVKAPADGDYRMVWYQGGASGYPSPNGLMLAPGGEPTPNRGTGSGMTQDVYYGINDIQPEQYALIAFSQSGTTMSQFLNGLPNGTQSSTITPADGEGSSPLYIGTRGDFYDLFTADLEMAELMIFSSSLSASNMTEVENYLGTKYGMVLAVPGPHLAPTVTIDSPTNNSTLAAPGNFTVTASVTPSTGSIVSAALSVNGFPFATLTGPPYQWPLSVASAGSLTLTLLATDNLGATNSATALVTVTGDTNATFTPGTNLVLWLKADAGVTTDGASNVLAWADQSSYGNNAETGTNSPILMSNAVNGLPALYFDTSISSYLQIPHSASLAITNDIASFVVFAPNVNSPGNYREIWWQGNGVPSPNAFFMFPGNQPAPGYGDGTNQVFFPAPISVPDVQYSILGFSKQGSMMSQYLDGLMDGAPQPGIGATPLDGGGPTYIGTRGDFYSYLRANVAELMIFNTAVAGTNLDAVRQYLAIKYGLVLVAAETAPSLNMAGQSNGQFVISWPLSYTGYTLQSISNLSLTNWGSVPGVTNNQVIITPLGTEQFYRLVSP
jgi:hypothetical protein